MRIRHRPEQSTVQERVRRWLLSQSWLVTLSLAIVLCAALGLVGWIWYRYEGYEVVNPWLRRLAPQAGERANELPTLRFDVGIEGIRALSAQRAQALRRGILPEGETLWQPAQVSVQGESVATQIRLAGDTPDHWQDAKWSLHVQTREDTPLLGMQSFVLQSPATCGYLHGWLGAEDVRRAGLLAPRYTFANVSVNGEGWGVYAAVEDLAAASLASQGRHPGPVLRLNGSSLIAGPMVALLDVPVWVEVQESPDTGDHLAEAMSLVYAFRDRRLEAGQALDSELMGRYLAHADLWGMEQGPPWQDMYLYYSPETGRFEPVGMGLPVLEAQDVSLAGLAWVDDLAIAEAYAQELLRISQPEYLSTLESEYSQALARYATALAQEFFPAYLEAPWQALSDRQVALEKALHPPQTVHATWMDDPGRPEVTVRVVNLLRFPVALEQVRVDGHPVDLRSEWVSDDDRALLHPQADSSVVLRPARSVTLHIPRASFGGEMSSGDERLDLVTRMAGMGEQVIVDIARVVPLARSPSDLPPPPPLEEALARHPFLALSEEPGFLDLRPGTWSVAGDLVLPAGMGLRASSAVTLTFDPGAWLVARRPLLLHGSEEGPVRLLPKALDWGGIVVSQAGSETTSSLQDVEIRQTTGGAVFDESPVVLHRCRVLGSVARYAVRVVRAGFEFAHTEFGYAAYDAFGGESAAGRFRQCAFHDIVGDGIALVESRVAIEDTNLLRIYGRAVSADRGTEVLARGIRATDVGIAVASAHRSAVLLDDARLAQAWGAGLVAYAQALGSAATVQATRVVFEDDSVRALTGGEGRVLVDGIAAAAGVLDVEWLSVRRAVATEMQVVDYAFGPAVRLIGYGLLTPNLAPGEHLRFVLYWQASARLSRDYTVFVHVLDPDGLVAAQWDAMPRDNTFPTTAWPVGEAIADPRDVPLPGDVARGRYRIALGLYHVQTGERLPASDADAKPVPDAIVVLDHQVEVR